jgi:hypothetical protein
MTIKFVGSVKEWGALILSLVMQGLRFDADWRAYDQKDGEGTITLTGGY